MNLLDLSPGSAGTVRQVQDRAANDPIARRLRELGFVAGEPVRLVLRGPLGGDPVLVALGGTRFALRRAEASRVELEA